MADFKIITEKTHPIEKNWVIKNVIIYSPVISYFIASVAIGEGEHFKSFMFIPLFVISLIIVPFLVYLFFKLTLKNYHYEFGEKIIILKQGIISKSERSTQYGRIQNISLSQGVINRLLGLASISIETASEGGGAMLLIAKKNKDRAGLAGTPLGFISNKIGIPGLSYNNALELKETVMKLIKLNPIDDAQSGL